MKTNHDQRKQILAHNYVIKHRHNGLDFSVIRSKLSEDLSINYSRETLAKQFSRIVNKSRYIERRKFAIDQIRKIKEFSAITGLDRRETFDALFYKASTAGLVATITPYPTNHLFKEVESWNNIKRITHNADSFWEDYEMKLWVGEIT